MKTKTENLLPKIAAHGGSVHRQFVRCGKSSCKCARGELHGAYYYYFIRVNGRLKKRYLKPHQVEEIQSACLARRKSQREQRIRLSEALSNIREVVARLRQFGIGR